jgi:hypothetical protein
MGKMTIFVNNKGISFWLKEREKWRKATQLLTFGRKYAIIKRRNLKTESLRNCAQR